MTKVSTNKEYRGDPVDTNRVIVEETGHRTILTPAASQRVYNHSPDGFSWGYRGSGPAQLALALMLDFFDGDHHKAQRYYQDFKESKVASWPSEAPWKITTAEIQAVIDEIDAKRMEIANQMRTQNS